MSAIVTLNTVITGEFISGTESVTVTEKAAKLANLFRNANDGLTAVLTQESDWETVRAIMLETLQQLPERDDREAFGLAYRKAQQRERERMAYVAVQLRNGALPINEGESFDDALMRNRRFRWLTDTMSVSMKTAKFDKLAVDHKAVDSYIPPIVTVTETETKPESKPESVTVTETETKPESVTVTETETKPESKLETVAKSVSDIWQNRAVEAEAGLIKQSERIAQLEAENRALLAKLDEIAAERNRLETENKALKFDAKPKRNRKAA